MPQQQTKPKRRNTRQALIQAGIQEINQHGVGGFSMRRIAQACGVSCGAPYKHFGDRKEFVAAVIEYVNGQWFTLQREILEEYQGDTARQLVEISTAYVKFLMDNPHLHAILTLKDQEFDNVYHKMRGELSSPTQRLIQRYCQERDIPDQVRHRKVYVVRSLIFGAIILIQNGELVYNEETLQMVHDSIQRELELP